jgi:prepilin-type N-terminal cleavage/methylation domain-containing protein
MENMKTPNVKKNEGFSIIELIIVLTIIGIMSGISIFYLSGNRRLYRVEDQALRISDFLSEARQRALNQREVMRIQIDTTDSKIRLIDENSSLTETDDVIIRELTLEQSDEVRMATVPNNIRTTPPEPSPVPAAQYPVSFYPLSFGNDVFTLRFLSNGTVVNAGTDNIGTNAVLSGATLYFWKPKANTPNETEMTRAISVLASSGSIKLWAHTFSETGSEVWNDSRKGGSGRPGTCLNTNGNSNANCL